MSRVILTFATGAPIYREMAKGLAMSLRLHGCTAKLAIFTDEPDDVELNDLFDIVQSPPAGYDHWFMKLAGLEALDADEILFLDGDGLAVRNADRIFDAVEGMDFAVQGRWETSPGQWYGDANAAIARQGFQAIPRFSGGFLYYRRTDATMTLFREIFAYRDRYDELGLERNGGHVVDEVCISFAMSKTGVGTVIPDSAQLSTTPWRRVSRVHLDVLRGQCDFLRKVDGIEAASPIIYHTAMARWDLVYWRELRRILNLYRSKSELPEFSQAPFSTIRRKFRRATVEVYRRLFF